MVFGKKVNGEKYVFGSIPNSVRHNISTSQMKASSRVRHWWRILISAIKIVVLFLLSFVDGRMMAVYMDLKKSDEDAVRLVGFTTYNGSTTTTEANDSKSKSPPLRSLSVGDDERTGRLSPTVIDDNVTIKLNGSVVVNDDQEQLNNAGVRLVGFSRSSSLGRGDLDRVLLRAKNARTPGAPTAHNLCPQNSTAKVRFHRLKAEAQELLSRSKRTKQQLGRNNETVGDGREQSEHVGNFVRENQDRFIEMFDNFSRVLLSPSGEKPSFSTPSSPIPRFETKRLVDSTTSAGGTSVSSKTTYHMTTSKSVFEFCGDTNTFRFCAERMTQSCEQSFDVSESEDEDETASCSSRDEDTMSADSEGRGLQSAAEKGSSLAERASYKVAQELLTTEQTYVQVLHLIDQVFQFRVDHENRARLMFPQDVITRMFSNVKSIYKLHHDFLLPQLEQRLANWSDTPRIGDIVKNFAPFLKMYTEYVKNFDDANAIVSLWLTKSPRFAAIVEEIQKLPECGSLTLQHHMLAPVQRVPRYELLLKDYLRKLPDESPDREDTEKALHLVMTAANQSNEAAKKIDKFKKLLEVQDSLGGGVDLVSPSRELIRSGKLVKISARNGDHQDRHVFLFSDLLLLCSPRNIANRVVASTHSFRIRAHLQVDGLQVSEGDNLVTANTFYVRNNHKSIELYTQTPEERDDWLKALENAVEEFRRRKSSLRVIQEDANTNNYELGLKPPVPSVSNPDAVETCTVCKSNFGTFRRRQTCRACGSVVCAKCSPQKLPLQYDGNRPHRVCKFCYDILLPAQSGNRLTTSVPVVGSSSTNSISSEMSDEKTSTSVQNGNVSTEPFSPTSPTLPYLCVLRRGILEVKAVGDCVLDGHLHLKTRGKTWTERWFVLKEDFVLYSFASRQDVRAMTSTPVPGFQVTACERCNGLDRDHVFKLFHKKKAYFFQASSEAEMTTWIYALDRASRAELTPVS